MLLPVLIILLVLAPVLVPAIITAVHALSPAPQIGTGKRVGAASGRRTTSARPSA